MSRSIKDKININTFLFDKENDILVRYYNSRKMKQTSVAVDHIGDGRTDPAFFV